MKKFFESYFSLFLIAFGIIVVDQITKIIVRTQLPVEGQTWVPWEWLMPYARIVHWKNSGVAFGLFQGRGNLFTILAIIVAIAIIYYFPRVSPEDWLLRLAMGMQLGGALGNLVDRVTLGQVTDFISLGTFPVFNVADASITVGVCILILGVWLQERRDKQRAEAAERLASVIQAEPESIPGTVDDLSSRDHKAGG